MAQKHDAVWLCDESKNTVLLTELGHGFAISNVQDCIILQYCRMLHYMYVFLCDVMTQNIQTFYCSVGNI